MVLPTLHENILLKKDCFLFPVKMHCHYKPLSSMFWHLLILNGFSFMITQDKYFEAAFRELMK